MISRRRVIAFAATAPLIGGALGATVENSRRYRIGILFFGAPARDVSLESQMSELGWVNGTNVSYSYRFARVNDDLPALAKELVDEPVDIIFTSGTPASLAASEATNNSTIPVPGRRWSRRESQATWW